MYPSIEIIQRLFSLLALILDNSSQQHNLHFDRVIVNGRLNEDALRDVETTLSTEMGRTDLVSIIRHTMQGNYSLLEDHEQHYLPNRREFHHATGPDHAARQWPNVCFQFSENSCPVRQVSGCTTERGLVVAEEIQGPQDRENENQRHRDEQPPREAQALPDQPSPPRKPRSEVLRKGRNPPSPSLDPSRMSRPHAPLFTETCCICGRNIQDIQNHNWPRIAQLMKRLSHEELLAFEDKINNYDPGILNCDQRKASSLSRHQICDALKRCNPRGGKSVVEILIYAFESIDRHDLANEVRDLANEVREL